MTTVGLRIFALVLCVASCAGLITVVALPESFEALAFFCGGMLANGCWMWKSFPRNLTS